MAYTKQNFQDGDTLYASQLEKMEDAILELEKSGGESGGVSGYYTPQVTQPNSNTMRVSFTASESSMPAVEAKNITLPAGPAGKTPEKGTDYWTAADKAEVINDVLTSLPVYAGEVEDA